MTAGLRTRRADNQSDTIIAMTSNAGSRTKAERSASGRRYPSRAGRALKALNDFLRPEFISRIDEVVAFNNLPKEHFSRIARICSRSHRPQDKGIAFSFDDSLIDYLVEKSFSVKYGARNRDA